MRRKFLILISIVFFHFLAAGQDMLGISSSNYAGVYGISANPSNMVANRLYMDFNLIGFQGFIASNYIYMQTGEFYQFLKDRTLPVYYTDEREKRNYTIDRTMEMKHGVQNLRIMGPSAMVVKGRHAFGLTTSFRSTTAVRELPPEMAIFFYEGIDYQYQHEINYVHDHTIKGNSMAWVELGLSYAYNFHRHRWNYWSAGITIKPLFGNAGLYAAATGADYYVHNDDSASVYNATVEFGLALPVDYETDEFLSPLGTRGFGMGIDLGITFQKTEKGHSTRIYPRLCEPPFEEYNYRIGFSVLDLGYIKFKENAVQKTYTNTSTEWYRPYDTVKYSSISNLLYKIDNHFLDNAETYESKETFTLYLPPSISFQADVKLRKYTYINVTGVYGLKLGKRALSRPSVLSVSARYETARWEVSMPISLYEWNILEPRIGLAARYGNFFIGVDRLNALLGLSKFNGIDFYAGLRLNLSNLFRMNFIKGNCGLRKMYNIETFDYRNF